MSVADSSLYCSSCGLPLTEPRQAECGDRICKTCHDSLTTSSRKNFVCSKCNTVTLLKDLFRDKAVERDLKVVKFPCINRHCAWKGNSYDFRDHLDNCGYAMVTCPNCGVELTRRELEDHLTSCPSKPLLCEWCHEKVPRNKIDDHLKQSCDGVMIPCTAGCGVKLVRKELSEHLKTTCKKRIRPCKFQDLKCNFKGNFEELTHHNKESLSYHLELVHDALKDSGSFKGPSTLTAPTTTNAATTATNIVALAEPKTMSQVVRQKFDSTDRHLVTLHQELTRLAEEFTRKLNPLTDGLIKMEATMHDFQESFSELALLVQTLQATSYNGEFIWKIPEVARRREEARTGKTISLYSAPFYTSRFGYKLCLRLYMDGDGSGKHECLSFFLTIMRGEYDALLPWPFQQAVTLILLDQDKQNDIVQSFCPEPTSTSFWRPRADMNIASGCPRFTDLSVLNNPSYTRNNTMFLKCIVDKTGLLPP